MLRVGRDTAIAGTVRTTRTNSTGAKGLPFAAGLLLVGPSSHVCGSLRNIAAMYPYGAESSVAERKLFLSVVLHAHLPWLVNHGTWPQGLYWLLEADAETYLPLLRVLQRLQQDGIAPGLSMDFSPILLEQLAHPVFQEKFPEYLQRKIDFAHADEAAFQAEGEEQLAALARFWQGWYREALEHFRALNQDIVGAFRRLGEAGTVQLLTCCATHGYSPLLGTDETVRAQVRLAVVTHRRHFGAAPRGIWLPECGYRPAGYWQPPVAGDGGRNFPGFYRIGVEHALLESGLRFFVADGHLIEGSRGFGSAFGSFNSALAADADLEAERPANTLYQAYGVEDRSSPQASGKTTVFPRDPRTGFQVWSGDSGYPADGVYLDFHKKRSPGGLRYWRVTGRGVGLGEKAIYAPEEALQRAGEHGRHFVSLVRGQLQRAADTGGLEGPPMLCSPFDAELFGHWWFEGVAFLEAMARELAAGATGVTPVGCAQYLQRYPPKQTLGLPEGSWGEGGDDRVWLNETTRWTWSRLYSAEHALRDLCTAGEWRDGAMGERLMKQMCRELLLLESSDWQFLMTTGAASDYAEQRFREHADMFDEVRTMWLEFRRGGRLPESMESRLGAIEWRDNPFAEVNPEFWVLGARAVELQA